MRTTITRRKFIRMGLTAAAGLSVMGCSPFWNGRDDPVLTDQPPPLEESSEGKALEISSQPSSESSKAFLTRPLGKTGFQTSIVGVGGAFAIARDSKKADRILNRALDLGVNYIDTAPTYGASEENIGRALKARRKEFFLASKSLDRTYEGTLRLFEQSLKRLKTDHINLLQLHGVHTQRDLDNVFARRGALKALIELKEAGLIGFTGITGHKDSQVLLKGIKEYDFDCLLLPLNAADPHLRPFQTELLQEALKKKMGIIAMKVASYGRIFKTNGIECMEQALGYVLSFPVSTAIVGISTLEELEENVRITTHFQPLSPERMVYLEELVKPYYKEANFFKTNW